MCGIETLTAFRKEAGADFLYYYCDVKYCYYQYKLVQQYVHATESCAFISRGGSSGVPVVSASKNCRVTLARRLVAINSVK